MSDLETQITNMKSELEKVTSGSEDRDKTESYTLIRNKLQPIYDELVSFHEKNRVIQKSKTIPCDIPFESPDIAKERIDDLQTQINTLHSKWQENNYKIEQDPSLHRVVETVTSFLNSYSPKKVWENWKNEILRGCQLPGEDVLRFTDQNEQRIDKINQKKNDLVNLLENFPKEVKGIEEACKIHSEIKESMNLLDDPKDLPKDVKEFLQMTRRFGGDFPLEDFNDEIKEWLLEKKMLSQFSIKKRR